MKIIKRIVLARHIAGCRSTEQFLQLRAEALSLYGSWERAVEAHPELEELRSSFAPEARDRIEALKKAAFLAVGVLASMFIGGFLLGVAALGFQLATGWR